ncbi:MAG: UDP-N-acetylglucosamine--N-acetylmuramyl-(pentapeptide) pyrophosphoryl-undecaprenol N-acetylglucosamine transferase, partial [Flavobacteriales bacterium]
FSGLERWFPKEKIILTGNPIRSSIGEINGMKKAAVAEFGFSETAPVVFIMGGSLGAKSMNLGVTNALQNWKERGYQVIWQTGKRYLKELQSSIDMTQFPNVKMLDFIERMDLAYAAADLIVSRAGAMSIAELALVGKPTILVPSPNVSEDHQTKNALAMTENGAALLIKDKEVGKQLSNSVEELMSSPQLLKEMGEKTKEFAKPNAAKDVVDAVERLVAKS